MSSTVGLDSLVAKGYPLLDPGFLETYIRRPEKVLTGAPADALQQQNTQFQQLLDHMHLAERSKAQEYNRRNKKSAERARFVECIDVLAKSHTTINMPTIFPNLGPDMMVSGSTRWLHEGDRPLAWGSCTRATDLFERQYLQHRGGQSNGDRVSSWGTSSTTLYSSSNEQTLYQEETFCPAHALLGKSRVVAPGVRQQAMMAGIPVSNSKYLGEINQSLIANKLLPPALNFSVHIVNINPATTNREIFDLIVEGGVYNFGRMDPVLGKWLTSAVNIAFKTHEAAEKFLRRAMHVGISVRGYRWFVTANRDKSKPLEADKMHQTRILQIVGPEDGLNGDIIEEILHKEIVFNLLSRREWSVGFGWKALHLEFESICGQSRAAYKCFKILTKIHGMGEKYKLCFVPDPCNPLSGEHWNGHRMAIGCK